MIVHAEIYVTAVPVLCGYIIGDDCSMIAHRVVAMKALRTMRFVAMRAYS